MKITFEDIISLIDKGQYVDPVFLGKDSYVFVSNDKWTKEDLQHFNELKIYLKNRYNLEFEIVGGGKSCSKMIVEFTGDEQDLISFLFIFFRDLKLAEIAQQLRLKYVIGIANSESLSIDSSTITKTAPYYVHNTYNIYKNSLNSSSMESQSFNNSGSIANSNVNGSIKQSEISNNGIPTNNDREIIKELEDKIKELESSNEFSNKELIEIKSDFDDLKAELEKKEPKKKFVDHLISNLSKCTSLVSSIEKLTSLIPV
jgi:hypothetical protein